MSDEEQIINDLFNHRRTGRPPGHNRVPLNNEQRREQMRQNQRRYEERRRREKETSDEQMKMLMMSIGSSIKKMQETMITTNENIWKALYALRDKIGNLTII
jgi:hypothetical protein